MPEFDPTRIVIPGINDVIRLPGMDNATVRKERADRIRWKLQASAAPYAETSLIQIMTALDDAEDFLTVTATLGIPLFTRMGPLGPITYATVRGTASAMNFANAVLGHVASGRMGKLRAYELLAHTTTPDGYIADLDFHAVPLGMRILNPGFLLEAGQVLYTLTGYGLILGSVMGFLADTAWATLDMAISGRPIVAVIPPPTDAIGKAWRVLQSAPYVRRMMPLLDAVETGYIGLAQLGALHIVQDVAPDLPPSPTWESFTYTAARYDQYRDTVVESTYQTSTPYSEIAEANMGLWVSDPNDPWNTDHGTMLRLPWNPATQQSIDPTPYREEWLANRARAAELWHDSYLAQLREWWAGADAYHNLIGQRLENQQLQKAWDYHARQNCVDFMTWANENTPWLADYYGWEYRLLMLAIEEDVWPRYPRSEWTYCLCSEPLDPPTLYSPSATPEESVPLWLDRARFLWTHPGSLHYWWEVQPDRSVRWKRQPFRRTDRASALVAASYEIWGARFWKLPFDGYRFPSHANFLDGGPPLQATPSNPTEYNAYRRKTHPSNDWVNCYVAPDQPTPRCWMEVFPDGTWIQRCPRP
jgi:hypothetical protein